jgi:hypothetical protein
VSESNGLHALVLNPGQVLCLSAESEDLQLVQDFSDHPLLLPKRIELQRLAAKTLEVISFYQGIKHLDGLELTKAAHQLKENPLDFCSRLSPGNGRRTCSGKS